MTICSWGHLHITKSLLHKVSVWLCSFKMKACGYLVHVCTSSLCLCVRFPCLTTYRWVERVWCVASQSVRGQCSQHQEVLLANTKSKHPWWAIGILTDICHLWESFPWAPYLQLQPTISFSVSTKVMWPYDYMYIWSCDHAVKYFSGFSVGFCINEEKVITWARKITCQCCSRHQALLLWSI